VTLCGCNVARGISGLKGSTETRKAGRVRNDIYTSNNNLAFREKEYYCNKQTLVTTPCLAISKHASLFCHTISDEEIILTLMPPMVH
jgi:hypothetical protein